MANYNQISYGSSDSESVKKLQELLNNNGANLSVDGKFGPQTQDAVKKYQQENGLDVDGIVGKNTWEALTNASSTSGSSGTATTPEAPAAPDYSQYSYDASSDAAYQQALAALQQAAATVPTYKESYDQQLQDIYDQIVNRDKFSYDLNSDTLYQQYADRFQLMGQQASMDVMGQAAAMTGGYGNSYASTAGNQAYQAYLQQLNDVVPELYGMALDQYNAEGDKLLTQYSMLGDMADDEYGKYQDSLNQYWQNVNYQKQLADDAYSKGYNEWLNAYQMGTDAENTAYSKQQAEYEKLVNLITNTGYTPTASELAAAGMSNEQAAAYAKYNKSKSTSSTRYTPDDPDDPDDYTGSVSKAAIINMQKTLGVTADGIWGTESKAATGGLSAEEAYKLWNQGKLEGASRVNEANIKKFQSTLHPESQHDAVMRDMYGSYRQYVAHELKKIEHTLSDAEFAAIVNLYGLTAADGVPKR